MSLGAGEKLPGRVSGRVSRSEPRLPQAVVELCRVVDSVLPPGVRRVVRLFLAEAILMGIVGGLIGSAFGILGSIWLGKTVFGVAAQPRWIVYPVSVGITILVSIASAFPLRRLASVRPANVFRGEA